MDAYSVKSRGGMQRAGAWRSALLGGLLAAWSLGATAQDDPTFTIRGFEVSGAETLPAAEIERTLAAFVGPDGSFDRIRQAMEALERRLGDAGFGSARVLLPEQEVEDGRIRLRIILAVVGRIDLEGAKYHGPENIRNSVPGLAAGKVPEMNAIGASLRVANENPSKQTSLVFRQSERSGEIDALLRVADEEPLRTALSLDNTGTEATGKYRLGLIVQHSNLFDADHALSGQIVTSPGHERDVLIASVGYRIPLYASGNSLDLAWGYSNVDSGQLVTAGGSFGIAGSGQTASIRFNQYLPRLGDWEQKLSYGLDWRAYSNEVLPLGGGTNLVPDLTVRPLSLTYATGFREERLEASLNLSYVRNLAGGSDGTTADFNRPGGRAGASANYDLWRYAASFSYRMTSGWQLRLSGNGQWTSHLLVSGEQFGIGGTDSVRGFAERAIANDRGYRAGIELWTPRLAADAWTAQLLGFADWGAVRRNQPLPGEAAGEAVASAGLGLRLGFGQRLSARIDAAHVLQGDGATHRGAHRLHGYLLWIF